MILTHELYSKLCIIFYLVYNILFLNILFLIFPIQFTFHKHFTHWINKIRMQRISMKYTEFHSQTINYD